MQRIKYQLRISRNSKYLPSLSLFIFPLPIFPSYLVQLSFLLLSLIFLLFFAINTQIKALNMQEFRKALNLEYKQFKPFIDRLSPEDQEFCKFEKPIEDDLRILAREQAKIFFCWLFFIHALHSFLGMANRVFRNIPINFGSVMIALCGVMLIACCMATSATFQYSIDSIRYYEKHLEFKEEKNDLWSLLSSLSFFPFFLPISIITYITCLVRIFKNYDMSIFYPETAYFFPLLTPILIFIDFFLVIRFAHSACFKQSLEYQYKFLEDAYLKKEIYKPLLTNAITTGTGGNPPLPITPPTNVFNPNQRKPKRPY